MAELKTKQTEADVFEFIDAFANNEQKKQDARTLVKIMQDFTGYEPKMWGPSIIGFGHYHYKYDSGYEGDMPVVGFSPRKSSISLYVYCGTEKQNELLKSLGKFKMGKACIYVNKLSDINLDVLKDLMGTTIEFLRTKYK